MVKLFIVLQSVLAIKDEHYCILMLAIRVVPAELSILRS